MGGNPRESCPLVLLLLPMLDNKLQVKGQGLFKVQRRVGEVDYEIAIPHKVLKLFYVNLLKGLRSMGLSQTGKRRGNSGPMN